MDKETEISASEIAQLIAEETTEKVEEPVEEQNEPIIEPVVEEVKEEVVPVTIPEPKKTMIGGNVIRARRAKDDIQAHLENFKNASTASNRISALAKIIEVVTKYPKKSIFDEIFVFFKENIHEDFIQEKVALQGITLVDPTIHQRIRIMYMVMISIARGQATRKNISIELLRNIFANDDFANWVAIKLSRR